MTEENSARHSMTGMPGSGSALSGIMAGFGGRASADPHAVIGPANMWRAVFSTVWLVYLAEPASSLARSHRGAVWTGGGIALIVVFALWYLFLVGGWDTRGMMVRLGASRLPAWAALLPLFALAATACAVYGSVKWNPMWIYVSVSAGLLIADRRTAARAVLASGVCFVIFSLIGHDNASDYLVTLLPTLLVGFAMIGFRMRMELMRELTQARETVVRMAASEERLRLARDMHDLTGQSLSTITLKSELAARLVGRLPEGPERDRVRDEIEQVADVSRQALHDIREAISGYRRPTLAVEIITARSALESAGITPHDDAGLTLASGTFDPDAEAALAWCLREAATNVVRHSGARNCHVTLSRRAGAVSLEVRDDGHGGAHPEANGTGLRGMSERLSAAGGRLEIRPGPDGFRLVATVPASPSASRSANPPGDRSANPPGNPSASPSPGRPAASPAPRGATVTG